MTVVRGSDGFGPRWGLAMQFPQEWPWIKCAHLQALRWLFCEGWRRGFLADAVEGGVLTWREFWRYLQWPPSLGVVIRGDNLGQGRRAR